MKVSKRTSLAAAAAGLFFGSAAMAQEQDASQAETVAAPATVCLTNACSKATAIKAGDVGKVMELSGSPVDLINALRSRAQADPAALLIPEAPRPIPISQWLTRVDADLANGDVPTFIQSNGRTRLAFFTSDGRFKSVLTVPGMNVPGRAPVGIPFEIPAPPPPPPPPPLPPLPPPGYAPRN